MPKSKRDKKISLTKTTKKLGVLKDKLFQKVQQAVDEYKYVFIFNTNNIRNGKLKDVRIHFKDSRFLFGKNTIMARALGKSASDELQTNLSKLSAKIGGQCGLLFTNRNKDEIINFFTTYNEPEYPRAGYVPSETITVPQGPLSAEFTHSMEPMLRKLGMPTLLQKGVIMVLSDYKLCKAMKPITPEQSRLLKLFGHKLDCFKVTLNYVWCKDDGSFEKLKN